MDLARIGAGGAGSALYNSYDQSPTGLCRDRGAQRGAGSRSEYRDLESDQRAAAAVVAVRNPRELVQLRLVETGKPGSSFGYPSILAIATRTDVFSGVGGFTNAAFNLTTADGSERVTGAWVTGRLSDAWRRGDRGPVTRAGGRSSWRDAGGGEGSLNRVAALLR